MTLSHLSLFHLLPIHRLFLGLFSGLIISLNSPFLIDLLTYFVQSNYFLSIFFLITLLTISVRYKSYFFFGLLLCFISLFIHHSDFTYPSSYQQCELNVVPYSVINSSTVKSTYRLKLISGKCRDNNPKPQTILLTEYNSVNKISKKQGKLLRISTDLTFIKGRVNTGTWNKEKHYWIQNIYLQTKKVSQISSSNQNHISFFSSIQISLIHLNYTIKQWINGKLKRNLKSKFSSFSQAILTGDRNKLSIQQKKLLQRTGTNHLLAISGMHLSIIGGLFWLLFQFLWALSSRLSNVIAPIKVGAIISFLAITSYAMITGFNLPVQRAWIMFSLLIISWLILRSNLSNSLFLAAIIILLIFPKSILSISFYLSFLATYTVIKIIQFKAPIFIKIALMQGSIYFVLLPLIWHEFNLISITSFFTNLLVIPWLSVIVFPILILAIIWPINEWINDLIWQGADHSLNALYSVLYFFDQFDAVIQPNQKIEFWQVVIAITCILIILALCNKKLKRSYFFLPFIIYLLILIPVPKHLSPEIILSDSRFTKALFHNGKQAIVINPGYKNNIFNDAVQWKNYLKQSNITLNAIILQDSKVTKISSTAYLKKHFPNAVIITLSNLFLPFKHQFCNPINLSKSFKLITKKINNNKCQLSIVWEGENFSIFHQNHPNYINSKGEITFGTKQYNSQSQGEIRITKDKNEISIFTLRKKTSPWYGNFITYK